MYLQTLSTSDFETEKAEAVSCQRNKLLQSLFSTINFFELSATFSTKASSEIFGDFETRK